MAYIGPRLYKKAESALNDADWRKAVAFLEESANYRRDDYMGVLSLFKQLGAPDKKRHCYRLHVLGNMKNDTLAFFCANDGISWGDALAAKAAAADLAGLESFYLAHKHRFKREDLDQALRAAVIRQERRENVPDGMLTFGSDFCYETGGNAENVLFLLRAGANPKGVNGDLLLTAVNQDNLGVLMHLAQNTALLQEFGMLALQRAQEKNHDVLHYFLKGKLRDLERFVRAANDTLVENKDIDFHGGQLKTVFNFSTRRVTEIFENSKDKTTAISSHPFEDYDEDVLKDARTRLKALGGNPPPLPERRKGGGLRIQKP